MAETSTVPTAAAAPPPLLPRRRELLFGTMLASAGAAMAIVTLIGAYIAARDAAGDAWLAANDIPLTQPNMQLLTLGMSVVTMQWAVWSIQRDDRYHAYLGLGVTILLGLAFVNQTTFLYRMAGVEMSQPEGPLFYGVTTAHLVLVGAALLYLLLISFRALGGQFSSRRPDGLSAAAVLWYVACGLYPVIWFAVYVQK